MLELLANYAVQHGLDLGPGFAAKEIRWAIAIGSKGLPTVIPLGDTESKRNRGQSFHACPDLSQPEMKKGGVTKSHFLADTADVVALYLKGNESAKKLESVKTKHAYFIDLLRQASTATPELAVAADCLDNPHSLEQIQKDFTDNKVKLTDKVTFAFTDREPVYPLDSDSWHGWWKEFRESLNAPHKADSQRSRKKGPPPMRCFITGDLTEPVKTHLKINGLSDVGGLAMGDSLASFKQDAFCSYGLIQAANVATSEAAASSYRTALNHLIKENGRRLAGVKVVHWFKGRVEAEDDPYPWLSDPPEDQERNAQHRAMKLLESIRSGERPDLATNYYYAIALSGQSGRVMVRDWIEGPFEELVSNVKAWFDDLEVVRRDGDGTTNPPKFMAVLGGMVRDLKDVPAPFQTQMWRVAARNAPIPRQAIALALHRERVEVIDKDTPPNHARMGLLKAYHIRKGDNYMQTHLNENHPEPAYHCGRLMAVLANLQRRALGDVGAGVVQRFYAAASTTPSLVLGRLIRTSQFHLNKLEVGLARWYENKIANILDQIKDQFPKALQLDQQSLFALGYYQQMAADRSRSNTTTKDKEDDNE